MTCLPDEVLLLVIQRLSFRDTRFIPLVCRIFNKLLFTPHEGECSSGACVTSWLLSVPSIRMTAQAAGPFRQAGYASCYPAA